MNTSNSRAACKLKLTCKFDEGSLEKKKKNIERFWDIMSTFTRIYFSCRICDTDTVCSKFKALTTVFFFKNKIYALFLCKKKNYIKLYV